MTVHAPTVRQDARVIGLVSLAHLASHFFSLALPPLFPVFKDEFGVPYVAFGLLITLFYSTSAIGQASAGFLVDRVGALPVLLAGLALEAGAVGLGAFATSYRALLPVAVLAGLGNCVFHPADYAILNSSVDARRLGRGYSVHSICGNVGWALAPPFVVGLSGLFGWRVALLAASGVGFAIALLVAGQHGAFRDHREGAGGRARRAGEGVAGGARVLLTAPLLSAFAYFAFLATAQVGLQTFMVSALVALYAAPLAVATGALTGFLLGSSAGILTGGFVADRTQRHDAVAVLGMLACGAFTLVVASVAPPLGLVAGVTACAGFSMGLTAPSRDMLIRGVTPTGASGKVFGFVYSGLDLGSSTTPIVFGWLLDRGEPRTVFVVAAALMAATAATVVQLRRPRVVAPAGS